MAEKIPPRKGERYTAVAYIRVSTDKQELGPDAQALAIKKWARENNVRVLCEFREVASGALEIKDRKVLIQAMAHGDKKKADYFVVAKRDRLARSLINSELIRNTVMSRGMRLVSVDDPSSTQIGPEADLIRLIFAAVGQHERARIAMRTAEALAVKRLRGEAVGIPSYGWKRGPDGKTLVQVPREREVINKIISWRNHGLTVTEIVQELRAAGIHSRSKKPFQNSQIKAIIKNYDNNQAQMMLDARKKQ